MGALGGILTGALALAALETVVSSSQATSGVKSLAQVPAKLARTLLDPTKPLLPNYVNAPCADGGLSLSSALSAAYQGQTSAVAQVEPASIPNPTTLPPAATPGGGNTGGPPRYVMA